jgi:methionyl-tRNA formyltransferase
MLNIIFMGTPDFAVPSLKLIAQQHNILAVVTAPDKPAGRGQKLRISPVKAFALEQKFRILQPTNLKEEQFIREIKELNPDLIIVIAFRMLPKSVWSIPKMGTFNLHASLLPQYRGAAPINHAIINGETITGNTCFLIDDKIDTGKILTQERIPISEDDTADTLHDKLMISGAKLVIETVNALEKNTIFPKAQKEEAALKKAPKIFKQDCKINWMKPGKDIYNFIRGLSPYPTAWTNISIQGKNLSMKIFFAEFIACEVTEPPGTILSPIDKKLAITVVDGIILITDMQVESKKRMSSDSFLSGYNFNEIRIID